MPIFRRRMSVPVGVFLYAGSMQFLLVGLLAAGVDLGAAGDGGGEFAAYSRRIE